MESTLKRKRGCPPIYDRSMAVVSFRLPVYMIEWLKKEKESSAVLRKILDEAIEKESV